MLEAAVNFQVKDYQRTGARLSVKHDRPYYSMPKGERLGRNNFT